MSEQNIDSSDTQFELFSPTWIQNFIKENKIFKGKYKLLEFNPPEILQGTLLTLFQAHNLKSSKAFDSIMNRNRDIRNAIRIIGEHAPEVINEKLSYISKIECSTKKPNEILCKIVCDVRSEIALLCNLLLVSNDCLKINSINNSIENNLLQPFEWEAFAGAVAKIFVDCIAVNNPNSERIGLSNTGPVVSFLFAIIPYITKERPTKGSIYQHLRLVAQKTTSNSAITG